MKETDVFETIESNLIVQECQTVATGWWEVNNYIKPILQLMTRKQYLYQQFLEIIWICLYNSSLGMVWYNYDLR